MNATRFTRGWSPPLAALLLAGALAGLSSGQQVVIQGSLSNFDVHQGSMPVADNFELDFIGNINATDFYNYYPGWGIPPRFDEITSPLGDQGAEVMWLDRANPIPYCNWIHFGVNIDPALPPTQVKAWWTKVVKAAQIPVPFQWWYLPTPGQIVDVLTLSPTYTGPVLVRRDWAVSPMPLPLEVLQYDSTPVTWMTFDQVMLYPGEVNYALTIPIQTGIQGYLVRYAVYDPQTPGDPITRFVTEAVLPPTLPAISRILVNFDLHQWDPAVQYDNVELDLFGNWLNVGQVWGWYGNETGPGIPAWGVPPLVRRFPAGMFPEMPDRGGIEVTWVDKFNPFQYCHTYHFGLTLDPAVMGPIPQAWTWVQAYWTNIIKAPVPVPWQFWQAGPGQTIRDIILYSGEEVGPVIVNRQWVSLTTQIPLENLTWEYVDPLPWVPVAGDPVTLMPSQIAEFDVPVNATDRAALVRYTVEDMSGGGLRTRVINEALIDPSSTVPEAPGQGDLYLAPPRPNPAAGTAEIRFRLPEARSVRLFVADVAGRQVAVLHNGPMPAGDHNLGWDGLTGNGTPAPSGVYFYTLVAGSRTMTQRMVLER